LTIIFLCISAVVSCTLWDSYYTKFLSTLKGNDPSEVIIIILTLCKIKVASSI